MSLSCCCSSLFILPPQQKQFFVIISVSLPFPLLYKNIFFPCFTFDGNLMEICLQLFPFSIYSLKSASLLNMCDYTFITSFTVATLLCVSSLAICIRVLSLHIFLFKATLPKPLRFPLKRLDMPHQLYKTATMKQDGERKRREENHMLSQPCDVPQKRGHDTAQSVDNRHGSVVFSVSLF